MKYEVVRFKKGFVEPKELGQKDLTMEQALLRIKENNHIKKDKRGEVISFDAVRRQS